MHWSELLNHGLCDRRSHQVLFVQLRNRIPYQPNAYCSALYLLPGHRRDVVFLLVVQDTDRILFVIVAMFTIVLSMSQDVQILPTPFVPIHEL